MKTALEMIMEERERQVSQEGWTPEHDDAHRNHELYFAALCYERAAEFEFLTGQVFHSEPIGWPWCREWWKPKGGVIRMLVKAGALHQAQEDQITRLFNREPGNYSKELPRICMAIDRVFAMTAVLDGEALRVLREIRDHHYKIASEVTDTMRAYDSATEDERLRARLHESFVEALDKTIRLETNRG